MFCYHKAFWALSNQLYTKLRIFNLGQKRALKFPVKFDFKSDKNNKKWFFYFRFEPPKFLEEIYESVSHRQIASTHLREEIYSFSTVHAYFCWHCFCWHAGFCWHFFGPLKMQQKNISGDSEFLGKKMQTHIIISRFFLWISWG